MIDRIKSFLSLPNRGSAWILVLMCLVATHAVLMFMQPMLSSNKVLDFFGVTVIAGTFVRTFSCGFADVINEVFGLKIARLNVIATVVVRTVSWLFVGLVVVLPGDVKNPQFLDSMLITGRLLLAGVVALFVVELLMDAYLFDFLRRKLKVGFWLRYNVTNVLNNATASVVIMFIGFYGTGRPLFSLFWGGLLTKVLLSAALTPLFSVLASWLKSVAVVDGRRPWEEHGP